MKKILALLTAALAVLTVLTACTDNKPETNQPADAQVANTGNFTSNPAVANDEKKNEATLPADETPVTEKKTEEAKTEAPTKKAEKKTEASTAKPEKKTKPVEKTESETKTTTTKAAPEVKITKEEAKNAVLKHSGLKENEISRYKAELDRERVGLVYEIEFETGKHEYEYEINAENGKIIKSEKKFRD